MKQELQKILIYSGGISLIMDASCTHFSSSKKVLKFHMFFDQKNVAPHGGVGGRYLRTQRSVGRRAPQSAWESTRLDSKNRRISSDFQPKISSKRMSILDF